jgi:hypothetical protein
VKKKAFKHDSTPTPPHGVFECKTLILESELLDFDFGFWVLRAAESMNADFQDKTDIRRVYFLRLSEWIFLSCSKLSEGRVPRMPYAVPESVRPWQPESPDALSIVTPSRPTLANS